MYARTSLALAILPPSAEKPAARGGLRPAPRRRSDASKSLPRASLSERRGHGRGSAPADGPARGDDRAEAERQHAADELLDVRLVRPDAGDPPADGRRPAEQEQRGEREERGVDDLAEAVFVLPEEVAGGRRPALRHR